MDEEDPGAFYIAQLAEPASSDPDVEPNVEYFDKEGNNVTPLPLYNPEDDEDEADTTAREKKPKPKSRISRRPPKKNPIMRTLLHVTTALYSMAGLGSLEQSKAFKEMNKALGGPDGQQSSQQPKKRGKKSKKIPPELKIETEEDETSKLRPPMSKSHLPDSMLAKKAPEIDVFLVESDTIWMLNLPGTCIEIDPDADEDEDENGEAKVEVHAEKNASKYELIDGWTQTLDFTKKKKGTQCDDVDVAEQTTQVSMKNFLDEEKRQRRLLQVGKTAVHLGRSPLPSVVSDEDEDE